MGYKQEPCPLCGRDMTAIETYPGRGELYCGHCDLTIGGNNAKTPEEIIALMDSSEHRWLQAENAKLRELVRDAWGDGHPDKSCGDCEIMDECHAEIEEAHKKGNGRWNTRCLFERRIEARMRELGIEVDDG